MSYDLYLKPRNGVVDQQKIVKYFSSRANYKVDPPQAWYMNEDTGVYFVFELQNDQEDDGTESYPLALNINYFRPSNFIEEAEPEITAFVQAFDMVVLDPQNNGMGEGEYSPALLKTGWNEGNDFGYSAILREPENRQNLASLPKALLFKAWSWNVDRQRLQNELGESKFVPRIMFIRLDGEVKTAAVWPDGIPIAVPEVDFLIVPRKDLAPRKLFRRAEDRTIVALNDALPILQKHAMKSALGVLILDYNTPTAEISKYVMSLPADKREIQGLVADQVLDRELVEKYVV